MTFQEYEWFLGRVNQFPYEYQKELDILSDLMKYVKDNHTKLIINSMSLVAQTSEEEFYDEELDTLIEDMDNSLVDIESYATYVLEGG